MPDRSYRRFQAWQACHAFTLQAYRATAAWSVQERFGLVSQVRRAVVSAEVNIAEGCAKLGQGEFARYLDISQGSLGELECLLEVARDVSCLDLPAWHELEASRRTAARAVTVLYQAMRRRT